MPPRVSAGGFREVLLISGEPGLGKTTLAAEASRAAFAGGATVLFGHCEEDLASPYQLFAEALGHYITHAPEDQLVAHVAAHGSELEKLVPVLSSRIPDLPPSRASDPDSERFLLFSAVVGLLSQLAQRQPVVLVLDDLQWADEGSLVLLRHLVSSDQTRQMLILCTYRAGELAPEHPLTATLAALHRLDGIGRIDLVGLDNDGVVALMEAIAGYSLDETGIGLARAVHRETDGSPFFVLEVLRNLSETGAIHQDASGHWVTDISLDQMPLPNSVRVVIGSRVGRLGPDARKVLSMAAVIGRDFDLDLLAGATGTNEDDLLDSLEAAAAVSLVREPTDASGRYSFTHALIQHALFEDLGPSRRARAHRQLAEALELICGDDPGARIGDLARHWLSALQPIDVGKAVTYARQAGDAALAALAPADALRYYEQALDLYSRMADADPRLTIDLAIGIGTAQRQTGDPAFRETLLGAARQAADLDDTDRLVTAALANNRGWYSAAGSVDEERVELLERALDQVSTSDPRRALLLATLCSELNFGSPLERRQALADEALTVARATGDDATTLRVLNSIHFPLLVPSGLAEAMARTADGLARAEALGDDTLVFFAAHWRAETAHLAGEIREMDRCIEIMGSISNRVDQPMLAWSHSFLGAVRALIAGDTDRAEQMATTALQYGTESAQPDAGLFFASQLSIVSLQRGTMGDLVPLIERLAAETPDLRASIDAALALAHAEAGHVSDCERLLEEFAASQFDLPENALWITAMVAFSQAAVFVRRPVFAQPLFDRLVPWAAQWSSTGTSAEGPVSLTLGGLATVLDRLDEADAYFAQSADACRRVGAWFYLARTNLWWGTMLAGRGTPGDGHRARELLNEAHVRAVERGYGGVERRAVEALRMQSELQGL